MRWLAVAAFLLASPAWAQSSLLQAGPSVPGHAPMYVSSGNTQPIVTDSGTAAGGAAGVGLKELGVIVRGTGAAPYANAGTGPNGENICDYDAPTTNASGYHYICLSPNAMGGALISTGAVNGATEQPLQFLVNGTLAVPAAASDYTAGASLCYDVADDIIIPCPTQPGTLSAQNANAVAITGGSIAGTSITGGSISNLSVPLAPASGGTGVNSLGALSTAMGLGTMSTQNSTAVAITGGTITGMPNPSAATDVAIKSYVDTLAVGLIPLQASKLITITALAANTYANGASGVGATLTANANGALSIDGVATTVNDVVVVNNESTASHNGIYTVTAVGDGSNPYVLTRATYFDTAAEMVQNSYTTVTAGGTEAGTQWILAATVATVGSTSANFNLFSTSALTSLSNGSIYVGNSLNVATARTPSQDCTISNTAVFTCTKTNNVSFAASATTDATVATNITSGTLPAARLPVPSASTLGGVQSAAAVTHQFINSISTSGVPALSQPAFTDVTGTAAATQGGTGLTSYSTGDVPYASGSSTLSKLAIGTTGQVLTVSGGLPVWGSGASNLQTFTSGTSTWTKPGSGTMAFAQCYGGGGSGGRQTSGAGGGGGGGGGGYNAAYFPLASLSATETVTIGAGGTAITSGASSGNAGGTSSFGSHLFAYGGGGGAQASGGGGGGGGGGTNGTGTTASSSSGGFGGLGWGNVAVGFGSNPTTGGSGAAQTADGLGSGYGGGGGGGGGGSNGDGGASQFGGGGGGGGSGAGGVSISGGGSGGIGGSGGGAGGTGSAPSGGGGGSYAPGISGAGAAGKCIVISF